MLRLYAVTLLPPSCFGKSAFLHLRIELAIRPLAIYSAFL